MVVIGAKGHALEILDVLVNNGEQESIVFFDNVSQFAHPCIGGRYKILTHLDKLVKHFQNDSRFILGLGNSMLRKKMTDMCLELGGQLISVVACNAQISSINVDLGAGVNIMNRVIINPDVIIGSGSLINAGVLIHHQSRVGQFCEVCPGAIITGNVEIGDFSLVGAGATILPNVRIGSNVKIGAGSVVLKDVADNLVVAGNPAKPLQKKS